MTRKHNAYNSTIQNSLSCDRRELAGSSVRVFAQM